jgi:DNA-binding GntR family transcriptional regulator
MYTLHPGRTSINIRSMTLKDGGNVAERVYYGLKQAIADGRIVAGERLREIELAARYGVSRTPVREALKMLQAEGLLTEVPGRGLSVSKPTPEEIMDAYLVREVLEGLAARLAAERGTETDRMRLAIVLRQIREAIVADDTQRAIALSNKFDQLLFQATRSQRLSDMIEAARASQGRLLRLSLQYPGRLAQTAEERAEILQAIQDGDPEAAERATREHLRRARETRVAQSLEEGAWIDDESAAI